MHNDIKHGGDWAGLANQANCATEEIIDLSVNLNPLGPPLGAFENYFKSFELLQRYPEPRAASLTALLAKIFERAQNEIVAGNGSNELINLLPLALKPKRALMVTPCYQEYARACAVANVPVEHFALNKKQNFALDTTALAAKLKPHDLVMLGAPNNPAGHLPNSADLINLAQTNPQCIFFIDEAFMDFTEAESQEPYALIKATLPNLIVSRSFTKIFALPGLRMGAMCGSVHLMDKLRDLQGIWTMSTPAIEMARFLLAQTLAQATQAENYMAKSRQLTQSLREKLSAMLGGFKELKVYPAAANYILVETRRPDLGAALLSKHKIALRDCANYDGLGPGFWRIAVCNEEKQAQLQIALQAVLCGKPPIKPKRPTPALMIQGTCSNAGKSVLTAAFCRVLLQNGVKVAPFKAQNMALNSFVTHNGLEIGRAQAFQAQACRIDPDVRMNPVLLKPNSDTGSQVVLCGKPQGNLTACDFHQTRARFWSAVKKSYDSLAAEYDVIVLEGAGSPAEINLKQNDIVNMNMAAHAQAKVLLAGDIDRGGVYASFAGSYVTFTSKERELLQGFIINKFRGDASLLDGAHAYIKNLTGKPVWGVLDYLQDLRLPEEDSVSCGLVHDAPKTADALDCALVILPHIANFTDFDPLMREPDLKLRKVRNVKELGTPDIIIVPGTKNTLEDMLWLKARGLDAAIKSAHAAKTYIIGICGGLQLLGREICDPYAVESTAGTAMGLGLLPLATVIQRAKTVRQSTVTIPGSRTRLKGYEIHHGITAFPENLPLQKDADGNPLGVETADIFATYLHGVFDDDAFRRAFINQIRKRKGLPPLTGITAVYETESSLNRLANHLRERVDMRAIYKMLNL